MTVSPTAKHAFTPALLFPRHGLSVTWPLARLSLC